MCSRDDDPSMTEEEEEKSMERIIDHQMMTMRAHFGRDVPANFGWAMDIRKDGISISTKIYVNPQLILTTTESGGKFFDSWEERAW